jgi:hypothetical protein
MQHRDMTDPRTFRIKRLLNLQRSTMRPGSEQRSIVVPGKTEIEIGSPVRIRRPNLGHRGARFSR